MVVPFTMRLRNWSVGSDVNTLRQPAERKAYSERIQGWRTQRVSGRVRSSSLSVMGVSNCLHHTKYQEDGHIYATERGGTRENRSRRKVGAGELCSAEVWRGGCITLWVSRAAVTESRGTGRCIRQVRIFHICKRSNAYFAKPSGRWRPIST